MANCAVFFVTLLVLHATTANLETDNQVKQMKLQFTTAYDDALTSIDKINEDRVLISNTIDFTYKLESVTHTLLKFVIDTGEENSHTLSEIALKLSTMAHEVRQIMITQPKQLKDVLKEKVHKIQIEAEKLIKVAQNLKPNDAIKDSFEKLTSAISELHPQEVREKHEATGEIDVGCKPWVQNITHDLDMITTYNIGIETRLTQECYEVVDLIEHVVAHFGRESFKYQGEVKTTVDDVVSQLKQHRVLLLKVLENHEYRNIKERIIEVKKEILASVQSGSVQISRLCDLSKAVDRSEPGNEDFYLLMQKVGSDCLSSTKVMLWKLDQMAAGY